MPELPENEAQRLELERECLNRTIEAIELGDDTSYIELPGDNERAKLIGHQFTETRRHGKNIFAGSKTGRWMTVHLGMTGRLVPFNAPEDPPDHTKLLISFEGDRRLAFRCPRKLGHVRVIESPEGYIAQEELGSDALSIDKDEFLEVFGSTRSAVKSALMKQQKMAGVGNLWSDETLFQAGIHPEARTDELGEEKLVKIFTIMRSVLQAVVKVEADYKQLDEKWLIRHRSEDADCPRCEGTIRKKKVGGRTAYFCEKHQK
ncbi:DNA-formamidopyrimidine glycosylase family protein [Qipengyuania sp. NPDC077563]|uniref:DNA-formamidopyrimidine glycosylase family protein n=1 Tax=Qipengyuania sp. NPDC077563 TaxID=3364497 RepID=UPI00384B4E92